MSEGEKVVRELKGLAANPEQPHWYRETARAAVAEIERLTVQLQAARATIVEALALDDSNQPRNLISHVLHRYLSSADLSALAEHDKQVAIKALREAAADIPEQMRMDELALHQLSYVNQLPDLSKVMLNGATRFAERLVACAAALGDEATR